MGYVEVGLQTLVFSVCVFVLERKQKGGRDFWARHPRLAAVVMAVNIAGLVFYQALFGRLMPVPVLLFITLWPALVITFCLKKAVFALKDMNGKEANRGEGNQPAP